MFQLITDIGTVEVADTALLIINKDRFDGTLEDNNITEREKKEPNRRAMQTKCRSVIHLMHRHSSNYH